MQTVALKLKVHIFSPYCALSRVCLFFVLIHVTCHEM